MKPGVWEVGTGAGRTTLERQEEVSNGQRGGRGDGGLARPSKGMSMGFPASQKIPPPQSWHRSFRGGGLKVLVVIYLAPKSVIRGGFTGGKACLCSVHYQLVQLEAEDP